MCSLVSSAIVPPNSKDLYHREKTMRNAASKVRWVEKATVFCVHSQLIDAQLAPPFSCTHEVSSIAHYTERRERSTV
jgi:hypothetical protein